MIRIGVRSFVAGGGGGNDADAQAFITAAGITDATQQSAINTLVTDLKSYGIWTKMKAIYPFVGGTATTHKWNLKDPRDLDAAFRLVFSGGWTHSSNGATPNGTNGYANTYLGMNQLTNNNNHLSAYMRTSIANDDGIIGVFNGSIYTILGTTGTNMYYISYNVAFLTTKNITRTGFMNGIYISGNEKLFRNGISEISRSQSVVSNTSTQPYFIGAYNKNGSPDQYINAEISFSSIGDGLSDTEAANFYTAVQAYQTTLSRNV